MAIAKWKSEQDGLKAAGLAIKNAGPEPRKYWYLDAADPENVIPPNLPLTVTHPHVSRPHHHARIGAIHSDSSEADVDDALYMKGQ